MDYKELISKLTPDIYERLKTAVEIGKWPDGRPLAEGQKELCIQAVIAYDARKPPEQRTGYVPPKTDACEPPSMVDKQPQPLKWKE